MASYRLSTPPAGVSQLHLYTFNPPIYRRKSKRKGASPSSCHPQGGPHGTGRYQTLNKRLNGTIRAGTPAQKKDYTAGERIDRGIGKREICLRR